MTIYKFNDHQFEAIQSALNAAIGMALRFDKSMIGKMSTASSMMDDVANEEGDPRPRLTTSEPNPIPPQEKTDEIRNP